MLTPKAFPRDQSCRASRPPCVHPLAAIGLVSASEPPEQPTDCADLASVNPLSLKGSRINIGIIPRSAQSAIPAAVRAPPPRARQARSLFRARQRLWRHIRVRFTTRQQLTHPSTVVDNHGHQPPAARAAPHGQQQPRVSVSVGAACCQQQRPTDREVGRARRWSRLALRHRAFQRASAISGCRCGGGGRRRLPVRGRGCRSWRRCG